MPCAGAVSSAVRVEVNRDGPFRDMPPVLRQRDPAEAVPGTFGRFEQHCAVCHRHNHERLFVRCLPGISMQFQTPAPLSRPDWIQEHDQIEATMRQPPWMVIEVHVQIEFLPVKVLVGAAADILGIIKEVADARHCPTDSRKTRSRTSASNSR